jgi:hypothetical protein
MRRDPEHLIERASGDLDRALIAIVLVVVLRSWASRPRSSRG